MKTQDVLLQNATTIYESMKSDIDQAHRDVMSAKPIDRDLVRAWTDTLFLMKERVCSFLEEK